MNNNNTDTIKYKLIDWSKPAPVLPEKQLTLTKYEASSLNKGMAMNGLTKRWIPVE